MRCGLARDVWTSLPEALHQVTIVMSDRGIPYSYRHMHGFGSHTFSMVNANRERYWVKFHLRTRQGIRNLTDQEAEAIIGKDRESQLTTRGWVKIESRLTGAGSPSRGGVGQGFSEIGAIPRPPCIVLHLG